MLGRLKTTLREATDFSDPWTLFHDDLVLSEVFPRAGEPGRSPRIDAAIAAAAGKILNCKCTVSEQMFMHVKEHRFWHGTCRVGPRLGLFFYFEGDDLGLVALFRSPTDTNLDLIRFSFVEVPAGAMPSRGCGQA